MLTNTFSPDIEHEAHVTLASIAPRSRDTASINAQIPVQLTGIHTKSYILCKNHCNKNRYKKIQKATIFNKKKVGIFCKVLICLVLQENNCKSIETYMKNVQKYIKMTFGSTRSLRM